MKRAYKLISSLSIVFLTFLLFSKALANPFFQDDYLLLWLGWLKNAGDFWHFFTFVPHFPYRPIAIHLFGALVVYGFKMNSVYSHILLLILHIINTFLLWRLVKLLTKRQYAAFVGSVLYALSTVQFIPLFWWATVYMLLGTTFTLLLTLFLLNERLTCKSSVIGYVLFLLMLITNESLFVFPIFFFVYTKLFRSKNPVSPWPYFLIAGLFVVIKMVFGAYPVSGDYAIGSLVQIVSTTKWYVLRAFNISEGIKQMPYFIKMVTVFLLSVWLFLWLYRVYKNRLGTIHILLLGLIWFIIFSSPFLLLVFHASPYYLNTALIGFAIVFAVGWTSRFENSLIEKVITTAWLSLYVIVSLINIHYLQNTHWVVWRADIAKTYINRVKKLYPQLPKNATIVFKNTQVDPKEISIVLSGEKALQLLYNDPNLRVVYGDDIQGYIVSD